MTLLDYENSELVNSYEKAKDFERASQAIITSRMKVHQNKNIIR